MAKFTYHFSIWFYPIFALKSPGIVCIYPTIHNPPFLPPFGPPAAPYGLLRPPYSLLRSLAALSYSPYPSLAALLTLLQVSPLTSMFSYT